MLSFLTASVLRDLSFKTRLGRRPHTINADSLASLHSTQLTRLTLTFFFPRSTKCNRDAASSLIVGGARIQESHHPTRIHAHDRLWLLTSSPGLWPLSPIVPVSSSISMGPAKVCRLLLQHGRPPTDCNWAPICLPAPPHLPRPPRDRGHPPPRSPRRPNLFQRSSPRPPRSSGRSAGDPADPLKSR